MTENTHPYGEHVRTVNGICDDLAADPDTSPLSLSDIKGRIEDHYKSHDDPDQVFEALTAACGYDAVHTHPNPCMGLALGGFVPGQLKSGPDGISAWPVPLDCVADPMFRIWAALGADESLHPLVRARVADLVCTREPEQFGPLAGIAVLTYMKIAATAEIAGADRACAIVRAFVRLAGMNPGLDPSQFADLDQLRVPTPVLDMLELMRRAQPPHTPSKTANAAA